MDDALRSLGADIAAKTVEVARVKARLQKSVRANQALADQYQMLVEKIREAGFEEELLSESSETAEDGSDELDKVTDEFVADQKDWSAMEAADAVETDTDSFEVDEDAQISLTEDADAPAAS